MKREEQLVNYKEVITLAIYAERTLKIMESNTVMDKDVILYRGNRNVYIFLTIVPAVTISRFIKHCFIKYTKKQA